MKDKIRITNGYVSEFNGIKQLTPGKFGKMEVISNEKEVKKSNKELEEVTF